MEEKLYLVIFMLYSSIFFALIYVFVVTAVGTAVIDIIFRFLGKRGYMGNLFPNVRGGIPRAVGIIPFIILSFYMLPGFNNLILIIGIFALIDDILGRKKSPFGIEWGQLSRGIGIFLVIIVLVIIMWNIAVKVVTKDIVEAKKKQEADKKALEAKKKAFQDKQAADKKALEANNGDINASIDWLREKGISKAAKKADRIAAEGLTTVVTEGNYALICEINSETDFVAKNEKFITFVNDVATAALKAKATTLEEALNAPLNGGTVNDAIVSNTATIGEKLSLRRVNLLEKTDKDSFGSYLHR